LTKKRKRRLNKREKKLKTIKTLVFLALALIFSLFLIYKGASFLCKKIKNSDFFKVEKVVLENKSHIRSSKLISEAKIPKNISIFDVSIKETKHKLLKNSWAKKIHIRRSYPNKIKIKFIPKKPVAIVKKNSKLYYINKKANIIDKFKAGIFKNLPIINSKEKYYKKALNILLEINKYNFSKNIKINQISEIHVDSGPVVSIYPVTEKIKYKVKIGKITDGIIFSNIVLNDLKKRSEKPKEINASLPNNRVVVVFN
jgi:cell division septal protein FtsQ